MQAPACGAAVLAALLVLTACADGPAPLDPSVTPPPLTPGFAAQGNSDQAMRHQRLARALARALGDEQFRTMVYRALSESAEPEGKVHLQRFLGRDQGASRRRLAELAQEAESTIGADLDGSLPIEIYLPVPEHRRVWGGSGEVLVATAETDREAPVAFDTQGRRRQLDPLRPPTIPVIALGRAELAFGGDDVGAVSTCLTSCEEEPVGGGDGSGGTLLISPGLYMTYAKFNDTFEGWLKGSPEFEVHILGQDGTSAAMKSYQCAGALAGAPYQFDQNEKEWNGRVMLFSQGQLDAFKAAHPNQSVRVFLLEDDDGACQIKMDSTRVATMFKNLKTAYGDLTGGKDDELFSIKTFTKAVSLLSFLKSAWSAITTQDDLIGNAIEDVVAREYFPGANWIVKGENTITNGAIRLEMR
jgi:hypothetical protein